MNDPERARALGEAISQRMRYLGLSHEEAARQSTDHDPSGKGLSKRSITAAARGERPKGPHPRTAGILERLLGWPTGTVAHVLEGGDAPAADDHPLPTVRDEISELRREVRQLRKMMLALLEEDDEPGAGPGQRRAGR